eukprot:TRINITY_DN6206_c0_g1_i1.p1 TRINITY_DN6206_c0_g1~~TRINITY_DN6206_c0_g1_i1.p1  ORF type:complete len:251 (-),score=33.01 TRINITY_DN6206_c0_g1_i1:161-913(-)
MRTTPFLKSLQPFFFFILISHLCLSQSQDTLQLARQIKDDKDLLEVLNNAKVLLAKGFNAGGSYDFVWIRDLNTFTEVVLEVVNATKVKENIIAFCRFQGSDGNIPDGFSPTTNATNKNTVETDQETSMIQAIFKYINITGDRAVLNEVINGKTVLERIEFAFDYLFQNRYSTQYGLLWGATTVDWGDVQPEDNPGVLLNNLSHRAIDIYDNAMFVIAIKNYLTFVQSDQTKYSKWTKILQAQINNIRSY